jgi:hypothetical protein
MANPGKKLARPDPNKQAGNSGTCL